MFTDASDLVARNPPALHAGVVAFDADGDGADEFVVAGVGGPNRVLKWVRGRLLDVAPRSLADPHREAVALAAADVNGDGREELYVVNRDGDGPTRHADRLFAARPDGHWDDLFRDLGNRSVRNPTGGRAAAALDRRGTGRYGFVVANDGRPPRLYEIAPDGRLADLAPAVGLGHAARGRGLWAGPLASDRADVVCVNAAGPNAVFRNAGDGRFAAAAVSGGLADPCESTAGVAVVDVGGDRPGLCLVNRDGPHRLLVRRPCGTYHDAATPAMALPGAVRCVVAADFDNDGHEELFFHAAGEPNRLFGPRPDGWRLLDPSAAADPFGNGAGAAVADVDGDGVLELLLACGDVNGQPLRVFKCPPNDHAWLRVRPLTRFGAPARGAVVRLTAGGRTQVRVIDGGGSLGQSEPVAHFGLGAVTTADAVRVTWPDGVRAVVSGPAVGATLTVPYPSE